MKNLNRIESNKTFGWFARTYYQGLEISCLFSDKKYISNSAALQRAEGLLEDWEAWTEVCKANGTDRYTWHDRAVVLKKLAKT